jgi:hypothetical protein
MPHGDHDVSRLVALLDIREPVRDPLQGIGFFDTEHEFGGGPTAVSLNSPRVITDGGTAEPAETLPERYDLKGRAV